MDEIVYVSSTWKDVWLDCEAVLKDKNRLLLCLQVKYIKLELCQKMFMLFKEFPDFNEMESKKKINNFCILFLYSKYSSALHFIFIIGLCDKMAYSHREVQL